MLKKIIHIIIVILGLLGISATIIVLPVTSSVSIGTVLPAIAGTVLLAYGLLHLFRPGHILKNKVFRVIVIVCVIIAIVSFAVIETFIIAGANSKTEEKKVNYAFVLGAGIYPDGRLTLTLKKRLDAAYDYLKDNENVICVVSGGKGEVEPISEAEAMKNYLLSLGVRQDRIIIEPNSFSTKENMVFSAKILRETYPDKQMSAAIITSDFHMFRALMLAENSGIEAYGIPCETPLIVTVCCYMREYLAVINTLLFQME